MYICFFALSCSDATVSLQDGGEVKSDISVDGSTDVNRVSLGDTVEDSGDDVVLEDVVFFDADIQIESDQATSTDEGPALDSTTDTIEPMEPSKDLVPGVSEIFITQTIDGEPVERLVLIHAPQSIDPTKMYPLVFAFHGNGGQPGMWPGQLSQLVNQGSFVGVYPQGHLTSWNLGKEESTADDLAFVDDVVAYMNDVKGLEQSRRYAMGSSNGAGMVQLLGVNRDHFRAIAALSTALIEGNEPTAASAKISVFQLHGTDDAICPYEGGYSPQTQHTFLAAEESALVWAQHNGCDLQAQTTQTESGNTKIQYANCDEGTEVVHYKIIDGGHGFPPNTEGGINALVWSFFSAQL